MSGRVGAWTRFVMALRANALQATWNFERQQGAGWAWALEPALRVLYPDAAVRRDRLAEHTAYFNTQPTLASLALGAVASLEERRADTGTPNAAGVARVKTALGSALAALGDRLYWFSLRPFAAVVGLALAMSRPGEGWGAFALVACYAAGHLGVRFAGVGWGYRLGPLVLGDSLRLKLERAVSWLQWGGSAAVGVVVALCLAPGGEPRAPGLQFALAGGLGLGLVTATRARPSPTQWALGLGALAVLASGLR